MHNTSTVGILARGLIAGGDHWLPFLDCIEEGGGMIHFQVGKAYYVETFGKHYVGRVKEVTATEVRLEDAAWIADSGRLHAFLRDGRADGMEVEPVGDWDLPLAYVSGKKEWKHTLFPDAI